MLNIIFSLVFILVSVGLLINAQSIPGGTQWDIVGSRLFPQIMIICMGLCSVVIFIGSVRKYMLDKSAGKPGEKFSINWPITVVFLSLLAWLVAIKFLGFYLSALFFLMFLHWYLHEKKFTPAIIITPVISLVCVYVVFDKLLQVILPDGTLISLPSFL